MAWFSGLLKGLGSIAGVAGAPFTGGASLALPAVLGGLGAAGGALSNRASKQTSEGSFENFNAADVTPQLSPEAELLKGGLANKYYSMISGDPSFINSGIQSINRDADLYRQNIQGNLAARGIQGPAAANAENVAEADRFAKIINFKQNAPLAALKDATSFFSTIPYGTSSRTTSSGTEKGVNQLPGNKLGGGFSGAADMLALLYGLGQQKKPNQVEMYQPGITG